MSTVAKFLRLLDAKSIFLDLESGTKDDVLQEMVRLLGERDSFDEKTSTAILRALRDRERIGSTGIGKGVAIPHAKTKSVEDTVVALGRSAEGLDFQALDGGPVRALFMVVSHPDLQEQHLEILRWISKVVRQPDFVNFFLQSKTPREVQALLREMSDE